VPQQEDFVPPPTETTDGLVRPIAFYLPQFHPIPENDAWWEPGFTEWTNVAKARPRWRGHYQPHIPADLGFYDLRLSDTREAQAALAREYGIEGFCYWHYWFNGRRILERPVDEVLATGKPDFPFMLLWANENWTRIWDGGSDHQLLTQEYSEDDDRRHIRALADTFADPRYIRVDGKPVFGLYRASLLPDVAATMRRWREEARAIGIGELYLLRVDAHDPHRDDPRLTGFDAAVEFQPDINCFGEAHKLPLHTRLYNRLFRPSHPARTTELFSYEELAQLSAGREPVPYVRYPCVTPGWDNSPRRAVWPRVFEGTSPDIYEWWLRRILERFTPPSPQENFVFLNAWNEWAEGNHLEPDLRWGHGYLEATRRALSSDTTPRSVSSQAPPNSRSGSR
jgi:hypothetical protein